MGKEIIDRKTRHIDRKRKHEITVNFVKFHWMHYSINEIAQMLDVTAQTVENIANKVGLPSRPYSKRPK